MKFTLSATLLFVMLTITFTKVYTLQCYVCVGDSCDDLDAEKLEYCGPASTTPPATVSTDSTESTESTESPPTTVDSSSDSTDSSSASTDSSSDLTDSSSSSTDSSSSSTVSSSLSTDSSSSSTDSSSSSTDSSSSSTDSSSSSTDSSSSSSASTDSSSLPTESSSLFTDSSSLSTEASNVVAPSAAAAPADAAVPSQDVIRKRSPLSAADLLIRNYRAVSRNRRDAGDAYACYTIDVDNDGTTVQKRGCVLIPVSQSGCQAVLEENNLPAEEDNDNCFVCMSDGCNSAGVALKISAVLLLSLLLTKLMI